MAGGRLGHATYRSWIVFVVHLSFCLYSYERLSALTLTQTLDFSDIPACRDHVCTHSPRWPDESL
jgi:hypothetical protein